MHMFELMVCSLKKNSMEPNCLHLEYSALGIQVLTKDEVFAHAFDSG